MNKITVFDVAKYILKKKGSMSSMKLQKLVYYSQAWSLVWDDEPLFSSRIEAWTNGPVICDLYEKHKGLFKIGSAHIEPFADGCLTPLQEETIDVVLKAYGDKSAHWLSNQTHSEVPWIVARAGLSDRERGESEITLDSMAEYYGTL
jgi:uncharacterized phage-associated protein